MPSASAKLALSATWPTQAQTIAPYMDRRIPIVIAVIGFHVLGLWAFQAGLLRRAVEQLIPVSVLSATFEPPQPLVTPTPHTPQSPQAPKTTPQRRQVSPSAPQPAATPTPTPALAPETTTGAVEPQPPAPPAPPVTAVAAAAPVAATVDATVAAPALPAPQVPPNIELPSSNPGHLSNPKPDYPRLSIQLNEQGTVIVRVLVDESGSATKAEIHGSSGYHRLDQTALQAALRWRYVPGKQAGVPKPMWVDVPIPFFFK